MTRALKIEHMGDYAQQNTFPAIRLKGKWLERAGFTPGSRVQLTVTSPGRMELRLIQPEQQSQSQNKVAEALEMATKLADAALAIHRANDAQI